MTHACRSPAVVTADTAADAAADTATSDADSSATEVRAESFAPPQPVTIHL
jgi:hypothetical protein